MTHQYVCPSGTSGLGTAEHITIGLLRWEYADKILYTLPVVRLSLYSAFLFRNASQPPLKAIHNEVTRNWFSIESVTAKFLP